MTKRYHQTIKPIGARQPLVLALFTHMDNIGLSMYALSAKSGIDSKVLSNWRTGKSSPAYRSVYGSLSSCRNVIAYQFTECTTSSNGTDGTIAMKITLTQDGRILRDSQYIGFIEDEKAYVISRDRPHCLGWFDHRAEVVKMVEEHYRDKIN